ncbi:MAG TPA: PIN domain nuclease [Intrasporangiaceae bacterium]|nr:PIN domain nuclease [Intrasporangiaceae bacterium]
MSQQSWLIDKSALVWLHRSPDRHEWLERTQRGLVHITTMTLLELGYSARSQQEHREAVGGDLIRSMPISNLTPTIEQRAVEIQAMLASRGMHRAPSVPDVLVAATADIAQLTVLHVDKNFDLIAGLTGQPTERLAVPS